MMTLSTPNRPFSTNIISYMLKPLTMDGLPAELKSIHEKIDAR